MSLSSLIVQRQVATMRQVEEALARQVIYGGDLVTNLLEVARVDEHVLTALLAESMGLAASLGGELPLAPDSVRALVPLEMAFERSIAPVEAKGQVLVLAVAEPLPAEVKSQFEETIRMRIEQCAAPAVRVWQAISLAYGAPLDRRMQRLLARMAAVPAAAAPPFQAADSSLPASARPRGIPLPHPTLPVAKIAGASAMRATPGRRPTLPSFPLGATPALTGMNRASTLPAPAPPAGGSPPGLVEKGATESRPPGLLERALSPAARPVRRHRGPLTFDLARQDAEDAADRDTLLALFFDFSRQFFDYAALFVVQGDIAEGRDGFGSGAGRERVLGIGVPLDLPSRLSKARETRAPVVTSTPADGLDAALLVDLKRPNNVELAVVPLVVRTRVVALLVGDCGDVGMDRSAVDQIVSFGGVVSKAFERIIVRRKLEGFVAASHGPSDGNAADGRGPEPAQPGDGANPDTDASLAASRTESPPPLTNGGTPPWPSAVSVAAHRPPSARAMPDGNVRLPSVIVDVERELAVLVDRLLAGEADEQAEGELLRQGERAMHVLMQRFPGPVSFERARIATIANPPRASECGPLLRLVARERRVALPFVLQRLVDPDREVRGWATHLLCELRYIEALPHLLSRLDDDDASTRASAAYAIGALAKTFGEPIVASLAQTVESSDGPHRAALVRALGDVREPALVPELIRRLGDSEPSVSAAAHAALEQTTRQDVGTDPRSWARWYGQHGAQHRIEWLIDALTHERADIRHAAGEELRALSRQYFGYSSDLPARERERSQQRYRDWWITEGRSQHRIA